MGKTEKIISWREKGETKTGTEYEFHLVGIPDEALLKEMDDYVIDKTDAHYKYFKSEIRKRMKMTINPFKAGRPPKYTKGELEEVRQLRREGNTIRSISKQTGISVGKISETIRDVHN